MPQQSDAGWLAVAYTNRATETETLTHTAAHTATNTLPDTEVHVSRGNPSCALLALWQHHNVGNILVDLVGSLPSPRAPRTVRPRGLQIIAPKTCRNHFLKSIHKTFKKPKNSTIGVTTVYTDYNPGSTTGCGKAVRISSVDVRAVLSIRTPRGGGAQTARQDM